MVRSAPSSSKSGGGSGEPISMSPGGGGSSNGAGGKRGMEWSLRSLRNIDNGGQHFQHYYDGDSDSDHGADAGGVARIEQSAYEIFKGKAPLEHYSGGGGAKQPADMANGGGRNSVPGRSGFGGGGGGGGGGGKSSSNVASNVFHPSSLWAALNVPLRTGFVDGRKVIFELNENITQRPTTSRSERLSRSHVIINGNKSPAEKQMVFWLLHFSVMALNACYFTAFIAMNAAFALLFYYIDQRNKCCGDSTHSFADAFNFAIQTSTTIGYGSFSPNGHLANFLVVILSYMSTLMNTLFAGLLFTKFVTPVINIQFSEVMTLCNVNGVPCLSIRIGAPDPHYLNPLTDINVRLTYSYQIPYSDHRGDRKYFRQTEDLHLLSNRQHGLKEGIWTLRHVLDESSPLFGLNFEEHPANKIYVFTLSVDAVQDLTKASVNVQTEYALEDIMIGHGFVNVVEDLEDHDNKDQKQDSSRSSHDISSSRNKLSRSSSHDISSSSRNKLNFKKTFQRKNSQNDLEDENNPRVTIRNFAKLSDTEPYPVWYPAKVGAYAG